MSDSVISYWDWLPEEIQWYIYAMKNAYEVADIFKSSWYNGWKQKVHITCFMTWPIQQLPSDHSGLIRGSKIRQIKDLFLNRDLNLRIQTRPHDNPAVYFQMPIERESSTEYLYYINRIII